MSTRRDIPDKCIHANESFDVTGPANDLIDSSAIGEQLSVHARRQFLKRVGLLTTAVTSSLLVGCGGSSTPTSQKSPATSSVQGGGSSAKATSGNAALHKASTENRWGLFVDASRCADNCTACVDGCNTEHGIDPDGPADTRAQWIRKVKLKDNTTGIETSLPMMCQHCETAPCVDVCPTGASFRRDDGIVLVNKHTCIGCRYCMMACPFKARSFIHENLTEQKPDAPRGKGTVESCTLCVHRVDRNRDAQPACAEACTAAGHEAILFGDLNDPDSAVVKAISANNARELRADYRLNTGVRYHGI